MPYTYTVLGRVHTSSGSLMLTVHDAFLRAAGQLRERSPLCSLGDLDRQAREVYSLPLLSTDHAQSITYMHSAELYNG